MDSEKKNSRGYVTQATFNKYTGASPRSAKSKYEDRKVFCDDLSIYNMADGSVTGGKNCKYDTKNVSGVPMEYDPRNNRLYVDGSDAHTLLIGATGSKKSRLVVMPTVRTLAASGEGMVICDPKGEIYRRTAGYLEGQGYRIRAINLREPQKGDGWNLLQIPYQHFLNDEIDQACGLINDAAVSLVPISGKDPYWDFSARDMLFGLILLLFHIAKEKKLKQDLVNMQSVLKLREEMFSTSSSSTIMYSSLWKYAEKYELVRMRLSGIVICPQNTMSCIISVFDQHMACFALQPQIVSLLSRSTFDLNELGFGKAAVFLIMPDEKTTYHKIITIFIKQMYENLIENAFKLTPDNRFDVRINFVLDEFSSLPMISDFPQMISASRSRNIRFMLVVQSKHQLRQRYESETDTIMSNCTNWMFLTSRETELLREISELGGYTGNNNDRLISISQLQHLDKDKGECLVFTGRKYPYIASLPDIDVYDKREAPERPMELRKTLCVSSKYGQKEYFTNILNGEVEPVDRDLTLSASQNEGLRRILEFTCDLIGVSQNEDDVLTEAFFYRIVGGILRKVAAVDEDFAKLIKVDSSRDEENIKEWLEGLELRMDEYFDDDDRARLIALLKDPELLLIAEAEYTEDFTEQLKKIMEKYDLRDEIDLLFDDDDDDDDDDDGVSRIEQKISSCMNDPEYDRIMADRNAEDFRQRFRELLSKYDLAHLEDVFLDEE